MCSLINTSLVSLESGLFYEKGKPEGGGILWLYCSCSPASCQGTCSHLMGNKKSLKNLCYGLNMIMSLCQNMMIIL